MHRLVILLFSLAAVSAYPRDSHRIVGGELTTINVYPEAVSLLFSWDTTGHRQSCGGTIINNYCILTAAHCTDGDPTSRWRSRVGSSYANSGGVEFATANIIIHAQYDPIILDNDLSIIYVDGRIVFSDVIRPGRFAGSAYHVPDNHVVWAVGWGRTGSNAPSSEQLRHVQVYVINQAICRQRFAMLGFTVTDNMLCSGVLDVGGRDQCFGDSGSPLFHNGNVVGVCSWGPPSSCAEPSFPGVNVRLQRYPAWINSNL